MTTPSNWNATFRGAEPTWANACVGNNGSPGYLEYADGFSYAANLLLNHVLDSQDRFNVDTIIYPICFNIRHAVELRLKHAIIRIRDIYQIKKIDAQFDLAKVHDIKILWGKIVSSTNELDKRFSIAIEKIEEYIEDIAQIDPTGQTFRYPYSNEEVKHLTDESIINLFVIRSRFSKLSNHLSTFIEYIDEIKTEYSQGFFTKQLSRENLFQISKEIPLYSEWGSQKFTESKTKIIKHYALSGRNFSEALDKIKNHTEFSYFIKNKKTPLSISEEKIKIFFKHWIKINPQSKISLEEQHNIEQEKIKKLIQSIGTEWGTKPDRFETLIQDNLNEEKIAKEYWNSYGNQLDTKDIAYLVSFYENIEFTYSENFQRIYDYNLKNALKTTRENEQNIESLFRKSRYFENTIKNLLLLKEFDLVENLINYLELPIDNYPIQYYKDHKNMPDIFENYKTRFN